MSVLGDGVETAPPAVKKFKIDFPSLDGSIFKTDGEENNNGAEVEFMDRQRSSIDWSDDIHKSDQTFGGFDGSAATAAAGYSDGDTPISTTTASNSNSTATSEPTANDSANYFARGAGGGVMGALPGFSARFGGGSPLDFFHQLSLLSRKAADGNLPAAGAVTATSPPTGGATDSPNMFDFQMAMLLHQVGQANAAAIMAINNNNHNNGISVNNGCLNNNDGLNNAKMARKKPKPNDFPPNATQFSCNSNKKLLEPRDAKAIAASLFAKGLGGVSLPGVCRSRQSTPRDVSPASNGGGVGGAPPTIPIPGALAVAASPAAILFGHNDWSWHRNPAASIRSGGTNKQTPVWKYFVYNKAENLSRCIVGTCTYTLKGPHTSTLACHLKKHPIQYAEFQNLKMVYTRERSAEQMSNASSAHVGSLNSSTPRPSVNGFEGPSATPSLAPSTSPCSSTFVESRTASPKLKADDSTSNSPLVGTSHASGMADASSVDAMRRNFAQAAAALNDSGIDGHSEHFSTNIFGQQVGAVNAAQARFVAAMATAAAINSQKNSMRTSPDGTANELLAKRSNAKSSQSMSHLLEVLNRRAVAAAALANPESEKPNSISQSEDDCPTFARLMETKVDSTLTEPKIRPSLEAPAVKNELCDEWDAEKLARQHRMERQLALMFVELGVPLHTGLNSRALESLLREAQPNFQLPNETMLNQHLDTEYSRTVAKVKQNLSSPTLPVAVSVNITECQQNDEPSRILYNASFSVEIIPTNQAALVAVKTFKSSNVEFISVLENTLHTIFADMKINENRIRVIHVCGLDNPEALVERLTSSLLKRVFLSKLPLSRILSDFQRRVSAHEHFLRCDRAFRDANARFMSVGNAMDDSRPFGIVQQNFNAFPSTIENVKEELRDSVEQLLPLIMALNAIDESRRGTFNDLLVAFCSAKNYFKKTTSDVIESEFKSMVEIELQKVADSFCSNTFSDIIQFVCPSLRSSFSESTRQFFNFELVERLRKKYGNTTAVSCGGDGVTRISSAEIGGSALCSNLIEAANRRICELESNEDSWDKLVYAVLVEYVESDHSSVNRSANPLEFWNNRAADIQAAASPESAAQAEFALLAAEILDCPMDGAPMARKLSPMCHGEMFERDAIIRFNMELVNQSD